MQIPGTPIELGLGLGFPKKKEPTLTPTPTSRPGTGEIGSVKACSTGSYQLGDFSRAARTAVNSYEEYANIRDPGLNFQEQGYDDRVFTAIFFLRDDWYLFLIKGAKNVVMNYTPSTRLGGWSFLPTGSPSLLTTELNPFAWRIYEHRLGAISSYLIVDYMIAVKKVPTPVTEDLIDLFTKPPTQRIGQEGKNKIFMGFTRSNKFVIENISPAPLCPVPPEPGTPAPIILTRFPNPPPRKRNMDECCRDSTKLLREIYKGLGIAKFPGKLPSTIIQEIPKEGEQPAEPPQVWIEDFVDLLDWQFRRDDERWGQWVVQIDVKDADLTKEGDRGKQIKFPNLGESIAELEGQMLSVMTNVDALVAITTKNLVESGMARQESIKSYLAAKAIIKYLAFTSTEIDIPVPMTFTLGAETISELIKESEGHIKGTDYVEKETLRDIFLDFLQAAAIIRAVHWQKIDSKNDTKTQVLNLLKGTVD